MSDTESSLAIQDEEKEDNVVSIVQAMDDITKNGIVGLNPDWSSVNPVEEEEEQWE